ncbi:PhzF family phenazine biosynthesis protein [Aestuariibacter sp. AA17]|uniref:PhzF family phenazine biosynthesis protein n=1 Tax=Fluctibacter corallii TaxID=2984329 RepID=A0ABT3AB16_9ALTE|nr:PhzF family phenazine biosynthesis protein [Aestuariibacter sp. AA17]MCV2885870.1 PhzF family phenazine biosynthesis protein [Aestuariibacter sp. AA17]
MQSERAFPYFVYNVFTRDTFGGNPLAVIPHAEGLSDAEMQQIAKQFNYSETVFGFDTDKLNHHKQLRIFTPSREVPFAGHPNIGAAVALYENNLVSLPQDTQTLLFDEQAGSVPLQLTRDEHGSGFALLAPEPLSTGQTFEPHYIAEALSLDESDIRTEVHAPMQASVGLGFIFVEVTSVDALQRAKPNLSVFEEIFAEGIQPDIHVYTRSEDEFDIRTRMFAPLDGVYEDPATGSANSALAAIIAQHDLPFDGVKSISIAQGYEMGRPSQLLAMAEKKDGEIVAAGVAGKAVKFAEGILRL